LMFFSQLSFSHSYLHSFPTRRSSDLRISYLFSTNTFIFCFGNRNSYLPFIEIALSKPGLYFKNSSIVISKCFVITPALNLPLIRSEEHTSELQSRENLVCRLLLEKKK